MRDVHEGHFGINFEDDSLQRPDQVVVGAKVCCQCDDGVGHEVLQPGYSARTACREVGRHSVLFDAIGASRTRQEIARRLLCNRQRRGYQRTRKRFNGRSTLVVPGSASLNRISFF